MIGYQTDNPQTSCDKAKDQSLDCNFDVPKTATFSNAVTAGRNQGRLTSLGQSLQSALVEQTGMTVYSRQQQTEPAEGKRRRAWQYLACSCTHKPAHGCRFAAVVHQTGRSSIPCSSFIAVLDAKLDSSD